MKSQTMAGEVTTEGNPQTGRFAPQWSVLKMGRITGIVEFFFFFRDLKMIEKHIFEENRMTKQSTLEMRS